MQKNETFKWNFKCVLKCITMLIQQAIYILFYHPTKSFQFIDRCEEHDKKIVWWPQKILHKLFLNSTEIDCTSLI
jgi:hypothetical protein